jgi:Ras-related protein Rab-5C
MYHKKIVVVGDSAVGKTSIVARYINDTFYPNNESTIGAAFFSKVIESRDGIKDKIEIWDTAGQERYRSLVPMYYREAAGALIVYDVTIKGSLQNAQDWVKDIRQHGPENIKVCMIGNKSDLLDSSELLVKWGGDIKYDSGIPHYYASAKTGENIENIFLDLIESIPRTLQNDPMMPRVPKSGYLCC